jgi:hypothetical protein
MSTDKSDFTGLWLHEGEKRGQPFSHSAADYDHAEAEGGPSTRLRHAYVDQEGTGHRSVGKQLVVSSAFSGGAFQRQFDVLLNLGFEVVLRLL